MIAVALGVLWLLLWLIAIADLRSDPNEHGRHLQCDSAPCHSYHWSTSDEDDDRWVTEHP